MVIVCSVVVSCVPEPLAIVTVKVYDPFVPAGVEESPATAPVKVPATTVAVVPFNSSSLTNACALLKAKAASVIST